MTTPNKILTLDHLDSTYFEIDQEQKKLRFKVKPSTEESPNLIKVNDTGLFADFSGFEEKAFNTLKERGVIQEGVTAPEPPDYTYTSTLLFEGSVDAVASDLAHTDTTTVKYNSSVSQKSVLKKVSNSVGFFVVIYKEKESDEKFYAVMEKPFKTYQVSAPVLGVYITKNKKPVFIQSQAFLDKFTLKFSFLPDQKEDITFQILKIEFYGSVQASES